MKTYTAEDMRSACLIGWTLRRDGMPWREIVAKIYETWPGGDPQPSSTLGSIPIEVSLAVDPFEALSVTMVPMPDGSVQLKAVKIVNLGTAKEPKPRRSRTHSAGAFSDVGFDDTPGE